MPLALTQDFPEKDAKQKQWKGFISRVSKETNPKALSEVIAIISPFLLLPLDALRTGAASRWPGMLAALGVEGAVHEDADALHSTEMQAHLQKLADTLVLGALLDELRARYGQYELLGHWKQGEFHHDVVVRVPSGHVLVVATTTAA